MLRSPALLTGAALWTGSLALYLSTVAPTLTWGFQNTGVDGGELLAAAATLGVPHPPGYPTYTLLLRLFATVVPLGDFAFRGNLMSAVLGATAVALLYGATLRLCAATAPEAPQRHRISAAALAGVILAALPLFWSQAVITEVYTLNAAFIAGLLLLATRLSLRRAGEGPRFTSDLPLALFAFLLGLGLGNHLTLALAMAPMVAWMGASVGWRRLASPWTAGALLLGLSVYLYLPLRAAQNPPVNWGGTDTLGGMAWMLTGRPYQHYLFAVPATSLPSRLVQWVELVFTQFNPLGLFIGLLAVPALRSRLRGFLWASLASMGAISAYSLSYHTADFEVFMIPALVVFSSWVGLGFCAILDMLAAPAAGPGARVAGRSTTIARIGRLRPALVSCLLAFALLPAVSVALNFRAQDLRHDRAAWDRAASILDQVPDGSVLVSTGENDVFSLWYMGYVERPDRDVVTVAMTLLQFEWYGRGLRAAYPDRIPAEMSTDIGEALRQIVAHNAGATPVFFTFTTQFVRDAFVLENVGRLLKASPKP